MWDFFSKLVGALPPWFLVVLVAAIFVCAVWALPKLRRDKNGRWYIYSRSYQYQKNRIKDQNHLLRTMQGDISRLDKQTKSVVCENFKQTFYINNEAFPKKERLIAGLKYIYSGGNGAVREDVARFVEANPEIYMDVIRGFPQWAIPKEEGEQ